MLVEQISVTATGRPFRFARWRAGTEFIEPSGRRRPHRWRPDRAVARSAGTVLGAVSAADEVAQRRRH